MIVLAADTHKQTHTIAAIAAATGQLLGDRTAQVGQAGFGALLRWARELDGERVWAMEDCRQVSGSLERFLIGRGERVVRVAPRAMAGARQGARERGKSDRIDAAAVARAALRDDPKRCRLPSWPGPSLSCGCLSITANASSKRERRWSTTCCGSCTSSGPSSSSPTGR